MGTVPVLTWTRPASRYRSTKVLLAWDRPGPPAGRRWRRRPGGRHHKHQQDAAVRGVDFCGRQGHGPAALQRPGQEPAARNTEPLRVLPAGVASTLGAGAELRTSRIEAQQQAGRLGRRREFRPDGGEGWTSASGGHQADVLGLAAGAPWRGPQQLCVRAPRLRRAFLPRLQAVEPAHNVRVLSGRRGFSESQAPSALS